MSLKNLENINYVNKWKKGKAKHTIKTIQSSPQKVYKMSQQADQGRSPVQTERSAGKQTVLSVTWVDRTLAIVSTRWFTFEDNKLRALQLESQIFSKCTRIRYLH